MALHAPSLIAATRPPHAFSRLKLALALLCMAVATRHEVRADAAPAFNLGELTQEVLAADREAQLSEQGSLGSGEGYTAVYIGDPVDGLLIHEVMVRIDDQAPVRYAYGTAESDALQGARLHRILLVRLPQGSHQLHAEFAALPEGAATYSPRRRNHIDHEFTQEAGTSTVVLDLVNPYLGDPRFEFHQWSAGGGGQDQFAPGGDNDPLLHASDFLLASGHRFAAAEILLPLQTSMSLQATSSAGGQRLDHALDNLGDHAGSGAITQTQSEGPPTDAEAAVKAGKGIDPVSLARRDKANLMLGYQALRGLRGSEAAAAFRRVHSVGPYTSRALLGLGWAQLAPDSPPSTAVAGVDAANGSTEGGAGDLEMLRKLLPNRLADESLKTRERAMRRALVPWTELIGRDPMDPAVQESLVAIPYAMDNIGAHQQAMQFYGRGISQLEQTLGKFDLAMDLVRSGAMVNTLFPADKDPDSDWFWQLSAAPESSNAFFLPALIGDDDFQQALGDYRALRVLGAVVDRLGSAVDSGLRERVSAAAVAQRKLLEDTAIAELRRQQHQAEGYLVQARFTVARINDPLPTAASTPGDRK